MNSKFNITLIVNYVIESSPCS